uniref:Uncharacterized protein n=1 Tax=Solanum tuberosum TaxID=4113 RepID=M1A132_SOLTU
MIDAKATTSCFKLGPFPTLWNMLLLNYVDITIGHFWLLVNCKIHKFNNQTYNYIWIPTKYNNKKKQRLLLAKHKDGVITHVQ